MFLENIGKIQARQARQASTVVPGALASLSVRKNPEEVMKARSSRDGRKEGSIMSSGLSYDAVSILGLGDAATEPLPQAADGEIVLRYGGWSLQELRHSAIGQKLMPVHDWYDLFPGRSEKLAAGIYRPRVPVPESNRKTFAEQERMLPKGETLAPVVLVASALLAHFLKTGEDLLKNEWTRCREQTAADLRVALDWHGGRLGVSHNWDDDRYDRLWASSVRAF